MKKEKNQRCLLSLAFVLGKYLFFYLSPANLALRKREIQKEAHPIRSEPMNACYQSYSLIKVEERSCQTGGESKKKNQPQININRALRVPTGVDSRVSQHCSLPHLFLTSKFSIRGGLETSIRGVLDAS